MSTNDTRGSRLSFFDTALVVAVVVGALFVGLWIFHAVIGAVLEVFKIAVLVVIVVVAVRVVHALSRRGD